MNRCIANIIENCKQYFFVLAIFLFVLLSSCVIKTGIKALIGHASKTEYSLPTANNHISIQALDTCVQLDILDTQKSSFSVNGLLPLVLFSLLFLFTSRKIGKILKHPIYSSSGKIRRSIPLFLEHKQLIIPYAQ